eukprot:g2175.t1
MRKKRKRLEGEVEGEDAVLARGDRMNAIRLGGADRLDAKRLRVVERAYGDILDNDAPFPRVRARPTEEDMCRKRREARKGKSLWARGNLGRKYYSPHRVNIDHSHVVRKVYAQTGIGDQY